MSEAAQNVSPAPIPYTPFIDHLSATAWPPLSRTTPLGMPVVPDVESTCSGSGPATGHPRDGVAQLGVREHADGVGHRAVVHERALLAAAAVHVQVERVVAGVEHAAREPAVVRRAGVVEDAVPPAIPVQIFGGGRPEAGR